MLRAALFLGLALQLPEATSKKYTLDLSKARLRGPDAPRPAWKFPNATGNATDHRRAQDVLDWQVTQRCTAEEEPLAPLFNIALDFIMENNKNIYVNGWKMLSDEFKEKQGDSSVWLQETYVISRCEDMCGYLAWDQDVDGVTMIAAQFRCQLLNSKALEIWVNPAEPNKVAEYSYSCWASIEEDAITTMPACTMTESALDVYSTYLNVYPVCDNSHPIVADCLMLAAGTTGVLFLSVIVAPCMLLGASYLYIRLARKKAEGMEEEMMEETNSKKKYKNEEDKKKKYKTKSKAEGKYDDVRDMYADTADMF